MSDPRPRLRDCPADEWPAWALPRHGLGASIRCAIMAVALGCIAYACATRASGEAMPFPASVPLRTVSGAVVCHAAPMADGVMTAAHCGPGELSVDWTRAPYSVDASGRDLAHMAAAADPAVTMRPAATGEVLRWRSDYGAGDVTVTGAGGGLVYFAHRSGSHLTWGCSGTGLYGDDGALVMILTNLYCASPATPCRFDGTGYGVQVP